ncbi:MAG: VWA domain-containing protein [Bdellovibrionales bacterium]|nr:VWA domain-containing protein [Bdellovibrionales bacterium]
MDRVGIQLFLIFALVACSPQASKQYLPPYVPPNKIVDMNSETFDPKADILFVIDNSGSMYTHQHNLATNIGLFTSVFWKQSILNYNIAVISTDADGPYQPYGGMFNGNPKIVNNKTAGGDAILARNIKMGTNGSAYEKMFDPIYQAFSPQNLAGWNAGFLRDDASLIVIFITDAEDQSEDHPKPQDLHKFLVDLKGGDVRKVLSYGAIVPSGVSNCTRDAWENPVNVESFLRMTDPTGQNILSLCDPDYGRKLAEFATDIVRHVSSIVYLSRAPIVDSIKVMYGKVELPRDYEYGWSFDSSKNAIHLGKKIDWSVQPSGTRVDVYYDAARFDEQ